MKLVFGVLHHFWMRLQPDKNKKNRRQRVFRFTAGSVFWPISRVICVINEIGFQWFASFSDAVYSQIKIRKIGDKMFSVCTAGRIFWPISWVMGVINEFVFCIIFYTFTA